MIRKLAPVLALIGSLVLAGSAMAAGRDGNGDRIPDRWEKRHGLSLKVEQTRRDQDHDGLDNLGEWRAQSDPRDDDSDADGTEDGEENAGRIASYANGVLTIALFAGGELTGRVTASTEVECDDDERVSALRHEDEDEDEGEGEDEHHGDHADEDDDEHHGDHADEDEHHGDHEEGDHEHGSHEDDDSHGEHERCCSADVLKAGAVVEEAELSVSAKGAIWGEIELR